MTEVLPLDPLRGMRAVPLTRNGARPARVALVGGGPTTLYTLQRLIESDVPLDIHVFEKDGHIGPGMPYREDINHPQMLANIAGRELPPLVDSLHDWLSGCDADMLAAMKIAKEDIGPEEFYPRLVLGKYFTAQVAALVARSRARGHDITLRTRHRVLDLTPGRAIGLDWDSPAGQGSAAFDHVVVATGHRWDAQDPHAKIPMVSPWPADGLRRFIGTEVAILGTSLTAIDAAVALAGFHGAFIEQDAGVSWEPNGPIDGFHITMMSRKGLLPPADWYYDLPLPELDHFSEAAAADEVAKGQSGLLNRCIALLAKDLAAIDRGRADDLKLTDLDGLADRFFYERLQADPWEATRADLAVAEKDRAARKADRWRTALLRAHEVLEEVIPQMSEDDRETLHRELKPVFTDCYASIPHRSIRRMLALKEAGVLDLLRLGESYEMVPTGSGAEVSHPGGDLRVAGVIDARGQQSVDWSGMFPGLAKADGVSFDPATYAVSLPEKCEGTLSFVAIPALLPTDPFVQGLERARDLGHASANRILGTA